MLAYMKYALKLTQCVVQRSADSFVCRYRLSGDVFDHLSGVVELLLQCIA